MQNLDIIRSHNPAFVLILAGDHVYKMDYGPMLAAHVENEADMTVGCIEAACERRRRLGSWRVDEDYRVGEFAEKPNHPKAMPDEPGVSLVSMGIYVFSTAVLYDELTRDSRRIDSLQS